MLSIKSSFRSALEHQMSQSKDKHKISTQMPFSRSLLLFCHSFQLAGFILLGLKQVYSLIFLIYETKKLQGIRHLLFKLKYIISFLLPPTCSISESLLNLWPQIHSSFCLTVTVTYVNKYVSATC